jgi:hypothetical protein
MRTHNLAQVRVRPVRPVATTRQKPAIRAIRPPLTSRAVAGNDAPGKSKAPAPNPFARLREISERWARAGAHIGADPDILVIEDVALLLRCTVDTARRIPRDQLRPNSGPGRRQLYLREDVVAYVRFRGRPSPIADLLLAQARAAVVGLPADRAQERSQRRRTS